MFGKLAQTILLLPIIVIVTTGGLEEEGDPKESTIVAINWPIGRSTYSPDPPEGIVTISTFLMCDITIGLYKHTLQHL